MMTFEEFKKKSKEATITITLDDFNKAEQKALKHLKDDPELKLLVMLINAEISSILFNAAIHGDNPEESSEEQKEKNSNE